MKGRRLGSALAAVAIMVSVAVAVPSTANAVVPAPPVVPIPTLPSAGSGQGMIAEQLYDFWRALTSAPKTAPAPPPVAPISPLAAVARVGGAVLTAANVGWGLGQGGLRLLSAVGVGNYEDEVCNAPDWYQGINSVFMFGNVPECAMPVIDPNGDMPTSYGPMCVPSTAWCAEYAGTTNPGGYGYKYCWHITGATSLQMPTVWVFRYVTTDGVQRSGGVTNTWDGGTYGCQALVTSGYQMWQWKATQKSDGSYTVGSNLIATPGDVWLQSTSGQRVQMGEHQDDPPRTPTCTIKWKDGSTTTGTGQTYNESTGLPLTTSGLGCEAAFVSQPGAGPDLLPDEITVESQVGGGGAKTQISKSKVPDFTAEQAKSFYPTKPGAGLVLEKTVNGVTDSCNTWAANCSDWWAQTSNGTQTTTSTGTYRCTFGGDTVTLSECGPYRHTFDTQTETPTITDPATGTEKPWSATPSPGNSLDPGAGLDPGGQCFADGWASVQNPIDWVLVPVKCALVWAFVPRTSVMTQTQAAIADAWAPTIVGKLPTVVQSAIVIPDGGTGCSGPVVDIPIHLGDVNIDYHGYPLSACAEPMATLAGWARLIGAAVLIWFTGLGIIRRASAVVNAPGVGGGPA